MWKRVPLDRRCSQRNCPGRTAKLGALNGDDSLELCQVLRPLHLDGRISCTDAQQNVMTTQASIVCLADDGFFIPFLEQTERRRQAWRCRSMMSTTFGPGSAVTWMWTIWFLTLRAIAPRRTTKYAATGDGRMWSARSWRIELSTAAEVLTICCGVFLRSARLVEQAKWRKAAGCAMTESARLPNKKPRLFHGRGLLSWQDYTKIKHKWW